MNKASCLSLLSNAAVLWNTVHMARITRELRAAGDNREIALWLTYEPITRLIPATRSWTTTFPTSGRCSTPASSRTGPISSNWSQGEPAMVPAL